MKHVKPITLIKPIMGIIAGALFLMPAVRVNAETVDCEAARCTVQATIDAECSCADATNHGRYTSCVAHVINRFAREGTIPKKCRNKINGCAIRSTCGKNEGSVACDFPGDGVGGRCRPLASESLCTARGGAVVESCCDSCAAPEPTATTTPEGPAPTETPGGPVTTATATEGPVETATPLPGATATESPTPTATPEGPVETATAGPVATATEGPVATATPEGPVATATEGPVATATEGPVATATEGPVATATPEGPVATATEGPVATATEGPVATATEGPVATATPAPEPTSTPGSACGNGVIDTGEDCDTGGLPGTSCATVSNTSTEFACSADTCQCGCPTRVTFVGDPTDPASILDTGWTGIAHRAPIISNGDVTVALSCASSNRPCGTCTVTGPIANPQAGAGQLDNRRCTNDASRRCAVDATCTPRNCLGGTNQGASCTNDSQCPGGACPASGTCAFFFGSNLPLAAGGVSTCVSNVFAAPIVGTANVETGEAANTALLSSRVFLASSIDQPCARCLGDGAINDGVLGGTCDIGPRAGLSCDANGNVPSRPDFGTTSLDCPSSLASIIATLTIDLTNATDPVIRTLTTASPNCTGSPGDKCLCQTCNNGNNQTCMSNADCPDPPGAIGPICGGLRCLGGANGGAACTAAADCPGSSCARPGEPGRPSGCSDDTTVDDRVMECADGDGDGEGACTVGPIDQNCSVASGHAQRGCTLDTDCGGGVDSCTSIPRRCFLTGGGTFQAGGKNDGTDTLIAVGMEDPPMNDISHPTLGAVFCIAPTGAGAVNNVAGLPGPGRVTIRGTALGLP